MKVCPVCQYEEEQDSENSCAICGSDFGDSGPEETPNELEQAVEDPLPTGDTEQVGDEAEGESIKSDEEKLLEETLAATEVSDSEEADASTEESETSSVFSNISNFAPDLNALNSRLDKNEESPLKIIEKTPNRQITNPRICIKFIFSL